MLTSAIPFSVFSAVSTAPGISLWEWSCSRKTTIVSRLMMWPWLLGSPTVKERSTDDVESQTNAADDKHELWMIHAYVYISELRG